MKPKFRKEAELDLRDAIMNIALRKYPFQSCINCLIFDKEIEICKLANRRPPATVIVFGCPRYEDEDEIPF